MYVKDVINYFEKRFPKSLAEDFDQPRIGLVIGSKNIVINKILLTLDLTNEVVDEAIKEKANLIISHHPYIFEPLYNIDFDSEKGKVIRKMFANNISLYAMHTNLDVGKGGVNDVLASKIYLKDVNIINNEIAKGNYLRYGNIEKQTLKEYALKIKEAFHLTGVRVIGDLNKEISKAGIVGGSGAHPSDIDNAISCQCDCYITGEVKLNMAQEAKIHGLNIIEVNHGIEKEVFYNLKEELINDLSLKDKVIVSNVQTDPIIVLQ